MKKKLILISLALLLSISIVACSPVEVKSMPVVREPYQLPVQYELDNGLTVILRPVSGANQVAVVVLFNLGADHDPVGRSGKVHLLEHLYITAAAGDMPARCVMQILERYDGQFNAQIGFKYTLFAAVVEAEELAGKLKDAAARMSDLHITEADINREVPRILPELRNMYGGIPSLAGVNHARLHLRPIPGGGRFGGNPDHIKAITLGELQQFWQDYYKPNNAILVLAGGFDIPEARNLIQQHFGPIPAGKALPTKPLRPEAKTGETIRINVTPIMQEATGVVSIGYAAPLPGSKDYAPFLLVLSRLWARIEQDGFQPGQVQPLYFPPMDDPTTIVLQAALSPGQDAEPVLKQLDQRLQAALTPKLEPHEKLTAINTLAFLLGTVDLPDALLRHNLYGLAFGLGRRHQLGLDGNELRAAIQGVTDADVQRLATTVFAPEKRITVIVEVEE